MTPMRWPELEEPEWGGAGDTLACSGELLSEHALTWTSHALEPVDVPQLDQLEALEEEARSDDPAAAPGCPGVRPSSSRHAPVLLGSCGARGAAHVAGAAGQSDPPAASVGADVATEDIKPSSKKGASAGQSGKQNPSRRYWTPQVVCPDVDPRDSVLSARRTGRPVAIQRACIALTLLRVCDCPPQEQAVFLKALERFGPTQVANTAVETATGRVSVRLGPGVAEMMAILIGTRSCAQVRSHVQKHFIRLERERTKMIKHNPME
jgi:hypothetical protein